MRPAAGELGAPLRFAILKDGYRVLDRQIVLLLKSIRHARLYNIMDMEYYH